MDMLHNSQLCLLPQIQVHVSVIEMISTFVHCIQFRSFYLVYDLSL